MTEETQGSDVGPAEPAHAGERLEDQQPSAPRIGAAGPACLGLFALLLLLIDFSGVHPSLPGQSGAQQIRSLADQAARWRQVHGAFSVAGLLGMASVLWLRKVLAGGGLRPMVEIAAAVGLLGGFVFSATVFAEVVMIPDLAQACSASPVCMSNENAAFSEKFADAGWRVLPGLDYGSRLLMAGMLALALLGWGTDRLLLREAMPLALGAGYEFFVRSGLHGWGSFGTGSRMTGLAGLLVLAGAAAIAIRALSKRKQMVPAVTP